MKKTKTSRIVLLKITFFFIFINALGIIPAFSQNKTALSEDLWVCPVFEASWYSITNATIGGGAALGYGNKVSFGVKVTYWNDLEDIRSFELNFLLRFYLFSKTGHSGLFVQVNGGPVIIAQYEDNFAMPSEIGTFSAGLSLGWRFPLGKRFFVDLAARGGYPYIAGAGLSAGVHF
jgi:hypothetical protein